MTTNQEPLIKNPMMPISLHEWFDDPEAFEDTDSITRAQKGIFTWNVYQAAFAQQK